MNLLSIFRRKKKEWPPPPDRPMSWAIEYLVAEAGLQRDEALDALRKAARERRITIAGVRGPKGPGLGQRYGSLQPVWPDHWDDFCIDQAGERTRPAPGSVGKTDEMAYSNLRVNEEEIREMWG